jgi:hypothetical protein
MKAQAERAEITRTSDELAERTIQRRAVDAVIWGMPIVNYDLMYQAMVSQAKGGFNQIVYWSRLPDWKNQTLTPNPDAIYLMAFFNTKEAGPVVLEIPPANGGTIVGSVKDCWQTAIEDFGPAGIDKGKGGKYLILPPDHRETVQDCYIPMSSGNYQGYALLRSTPNSGSERDVAKAVDYARGIKLYPLSEAAHSPKTKFVDAIDVVFDATIPYDLRFFQSLDRMIQSEPWLTRDKLMIDQLKAIGIEKGRTFAPDAKTRTILKDAAAEAHAYLQAQYENVFQPPFYPRARWAFPASTEFVAAISRNFNDPDVYPTDARGLCFSYAFFSAKHLGQGQFYLMTIKDKDGNNFEGARTYRLHVPANAPIKQYWSATLYDRETHALIRNMKRPSRSSQNPELQKNTDGSVDLYFGPKAPDGRESNWVPTDSGRGFEVLFRLYGPQKDFFDKKWILPDVERVK